MPVASGPSAAAGSKMFWQARRSTNRIIKIRLSASFTYLFGRANAELAACR
jgi:hypothetical protein